MYSKDTSSAENQRVETHTLQFLLARAVTERSHPRVRLKDSHSVSALVFIYIQGSYNNAPELPSVSVSPSAEIVEGSSVTLTCSSDANPAANYTWYKEDEDSSRTSGHNFTISNIRPEHSGSYYCVAHNNRGTHNSTLQLTVVAGAGTLEAAGVTAAVLLPVIFFSVFLWIQKKRMSKEPVKSEDRANNREQCLPDQRQPEEQDDLQYTSIHFSNNQADPLYSNIRAAQPHRQMQEQEVTEYTAVRFNRGSAAKRDRSQETGESPCALFSTVNKTR
ncbi:limbic system-associated membrane protein-like [Oreochromis aureus]|uniref:limbic system-associated membrane protein-like n=1 Tax=Oreochromis aureus TaxID=47969 RepID=UPI00195490CA|nr:limbic system-associated membrane protein-like [Oreochromis aureus]